MRNKICPKCGCIFDEEKLKCIDCAELLRRATADELAAYECKTGKGLNRASDHSESTSPAPWQYIAIAGLMAYSIVITLLLKLDMQLIVWNAIFALALIVPAFRVFVNKDKRTGRRFWCKIYYPQFSYKIVLGGTIIMNIFILIGLIFRNE